MKEKNLLFLILAVVITALSSCKATFYVPNRNPVPMFKNKGDLYVDASTNLFRKFDLTGGYAVTDNIGVYAGYAGAIAKSSVSSTDTNGNAFNTLDKHYNGNMLNLGVGYFLNEAKSQNFRFEVFGDVGLGNYKNKFSGTSSEFFNGNYMRLGIMPNVGYSNPDNTFYFGYSIRLSSISFSNAKISDSTFWRDDIIRLNKKSSYGLLEHALTMRAGSENFKFQVQLALYHNLSATDADLNPIPAFNASLMFGLVFNTNLLGMGIR